MDLRKCILTKNACYTAGKKITVKGIMWHSTGANNPNLRRYVQPDDGKLGSNDYGNHWNQLEPGGRKVCVHAFIGKDKNGDVCTYQTLPWDHRGWHGGGTCNNSYIGFEICEDALSDESYFDKVYTEAVELTAYLCEKFNLDPKGENVIICHQDGYKLGIASNHSDVYHWFNKFGKDMNDVRNDVVKKMENPASSNVETYELVTDCKIYMNASNAKNGENSVGSYDPGTYYVFNKSNGMINVTKSKGTPGGWINPGDNEKADEFETYRVRIGIDNLRIRKGPGTNYNDLGKYTGKGVFTIVDEADGKGATKWGLLKSYAGNRNGWISLDYATKI